MTASFAASGCVAQPARTGRAVAAKHWIALYIILVLFSAFLGLVATFAYGVTFQHDRYWEGTIKRVQDTEIGILETLLSTQGATAALMNSPDGVPRLLNLLDGKLAIRVVTDGKTIRSNRIDSWPLAENKRTLTGASADTRIEISRYSPPSWSAMYVRWLTHPARWFGVGYDHITAPFLSFSGISLAFLIALAWRHRAAHLSEEVLRMLDELRSVD